MSEFKGREKRRNRKKWETATTRLCNNWFVHKSINNINIVINIVYRTVFHLRFFYCDRLFSAYLCEVSPLDHRSQRNQRKWKAVGSIIIYPDEKLTIYCIIADCLWAHSLFPSLARSLPLDSIKNLYIIRTIIYWIRLKVIEIDYLWTSNHFI